MKKFLTLLMIFSIFSCAKINESDAAKTAKSRSAQDRINSSQKGSESIFGN